VAQATGPIYAVHFRRRRSGRTDYRARLNLLRSPKPRLVVRKTNRAIIAQVVSWSETGDMTLAHATSKALQKYGFPGKCNAPSAYLTGFLVGRMAAHAGVKAVNLDIGLQTSTQGSIIFCALKGAIDAGLQSSLDEAKLPPAEHMNGTHLKQNEAFTKAKAAIEHADLSMKEARQKKVEHK
jgi:large subunit ribosomal protein L18